MSEHLPKDMCSLFLSNLSFPYTLAFPKNKETNLEASTSSQIQVSSTILDNKRLVIIWLISVVTIFNSDVSDEIARIVTNNCIPV